MAILTQRLQALIEDRLGFVPENLTRAISPLLAAERDTFVLAWLSATDDQHQAPAEQWVLTEEQRDTFERFRLIMIGETA
jgi:hypothetical protein